MTDLVDRLITQHERGVLDLPEDHVFVGWRDAAIEIERLNAEIARLRAALLEIFDYECQFSSTSLIACTARDALWPSQLHATLAGEEEKS